MKRNTEKGSAATELVLIAPWVVLFLITFFKFFKVTTNLQIQEIKVQHENKKELSKIQLNAPVLERPCFVHPQICSGRKK